MLKKNLRQNLILITFCFLLFEVLTGVTLTFVALGLILSTMELRLNKYLRNILALGVFASYWLKYGKIIDPEIGLNFLVSIIVLKILEKETDRDRYMVFFGLVLLISAGSLFERTLTYVFFYAVSFVLLIQDFYSFLGKKTRLKEIGGALLWVVPLTSLLFFFAPRLLSPIPFQDKSLGSGEIGYTPDVNISEVESLGGNNTTVFQVSVKNEIPQNELYWRGNTLSFNDGWNWRVMLQDRDKVLYNKDLVPLTRDVEQNFRLFIRPEYFFALDYPSAIIINDLTVQLDGSMRTYPQRRWQWVNRYRVISNSQEVLRDESPARQYLQLPLSRKDREWLSRKFPGESFKEVKNSIQNVFLKEGFSYSLSPGRVTGLRDFLNKKVGFCSHYSSAVAMIFRNKGIPSRLVSGFMGGSFNPFASFYRVSQNDAHVWVEVNVSGKWKRLDPTEWIAPDRVRLGGEAFMENTQEGFFRRSSLFQLTGVFRDFKLWWGQWDFLFYQWLEKIDYDTQESWFQKINFQRRWILTVIPLIIAGFILLYVVFLSLKDRRARLTPNEVLWNTFINKMHKQGVNLSRVSLRDSERILRSHLDILPQEVLTIWQELVLLSFQDRSSSHSKELLKKIKKL